MTSIRSNLPVPGSRLPKKMMSPATTLEAPVHPVSRIPSMSQTASHPRSIPRITDSKPKNTRTKIGRPLPVASATSRASNTEFLSAEPPKPWNAVKNLSGDVSESMSSPHVVARASKQSNSGKANAVSKPSAQHSQYNGPQLVEPCVGNALFHVLQPCGHRVMTRDVQLCGQNCKNSDSSFANKKTQAKFGCAICISRYVHEHYAAKMALLIPSLDMLEAALGGFPDGWKEKRIGRMERVWKNDALEEQRALEKLGRRCDAVSTDPEEEKIVDEEEKAALDGRDGEPSAPAEVHSAMFPRTESRTGRLQIPVPKETKSKSQLIAPSQKVTDNKKAVEGPKEDKRRTRIPVGPKLPRK